MIHYRPVEAYSGHSIDFPKAHELTSNELDRSKRNPARESREVIFIEKFGGGVLPIGNENNPSRTTAIVTLGLITVNVLIFLYEISLGPGLENLVRL